jgi:cysteine desulfurase family protein
MTIYLDNAATSFPKPESVYRAADHALRNLGGSPGRGSHRMALDAGRQLLDTRESVAEVFGIRNSARVVFTANATEAINLALFGLLNPGDRVVTSTMEHNAVVRPLHALQARGVQVVKVPPGPDGRLHPANVREAVMDDLQATRMVVLTHASNVSGSIQPVEDLGPWCRNQGVLLLVDAAQTAGYLPIDVESMGIDLLAAPGHKHLMGPPGCGLLYVREGLQPAPLIYGGSGADSSSPLAPEHLPERLESGTANLPALAGLHAGITFLRETGLHNVRRHKTELLAHLLDGLRSLPGIRLYGPSDPAMLAGVLSFNLAGRDPAEIAYWLDTEHAICVRAGLHCAPDAHRSLGTFPRGTLRVSPGYFSRHEDLQVLLHTLSALTKSP